MRIKTLLLLLAMVATWLPTMAHQVTVDGEKVGSKVVKQILFEGEDVTIVFSDGSKQKCLNEMMIDMAITGVNELRYYDAASVKVAGGTLTVSGLDPKQPITIVSATGQTVATKAAPKAEVAAINIAHLAPGVYLLHSGNTTIKFVKR